jgi:hypothetical protein
MSIQHQIRRGRVLPAIHFAGLAALVAVVAAFARWPGTAVVLFLCGGLLWLGTLWAASYRLKRRQGTDVSLRSAFTSIVPWYMQVPVCGLAVLAIALLPYAVAYRINSVEIRKIERYDRFFYAVAFTVNSKAAPPRGVKELLREVAAEENSAAVRRFLFVYVQLGHATTDSLKNAAAMASKFMVRNVPSAAGVRIDGRWQELLLRSAVFSDYANGRAYYYLVTDDGSLLIRPVGRK